MEQIAGEYGKLVTFVRLPSLSLLSPLDKNSPRKSQKKQPHQAHHGVDTATHRQDARLPSIPTEPQKGYADEAGSNVWSPQDASSYVSNLQSPIVTTGGSFSPSPSQLQPPSALSIHPLLTRPTAPRDDRQLWHPSDSLIRFWTNRNGRRKRKEVCYVPRQNLGGWRRGSRCGAYVA